MMLFAFLFSVLFCSSVRSLQEENSRWMDSDSLVRRRYWSPFEERMYDDVAPLIKRNFDEIDNVGFNDLGNGGKPWYRKRNLLVPQIRRLVKRYLNRGLVRRASGPGDFDQIDRVGFKDFDKRNFDEIDRAGFGNLAKRNFDEIDRAGFRDLVRREAASPVGDQRAAGKQ